jgi:alginate O-acetyltransferase complex protein AlgI
MSLLSLTVIGCLALTAFCAWVLPRKAQPWGIALCTAVFLAFFSWTSLLILTGTSLSVFFLLKRNRVHGAALLCAVGVISAIFVWFKLKGTTTGGMAVVFPLGLSYYSFRQIHYIFESYKCKLAEHALSDYLCWLFFLPTLHVGPIHRFPEFLRDLRRRRWDTAALSNGLERILYGYAKIVIVSNFLIAKQFNLLVIQYNNTHPNLAEYLRALSRWMNLYFQFSGYSDIAIGFSLVMGFRIMENFNFPFLAQNIAEYWQRWHISLSSWCRDYVYTPLASVTRKPGLAVLAAMVILGIWHEFSGLYVLWGLYNGVAIVLWHKFQTVKKALPSWKNRWWRLSMRSVAVLVTFHFVLTSFAVTGYLYTKIRAVL